MEKIIPYIENLLLQNDYVIIPELGGFVIQTQSAQILSGKIVPPFSIIGFNARMNNNDGLLATEMLRSEHITYREANKQIESEVEKLKKRLYAREKITIGELGCLYLNEEQQISFIPSKKYDFLPANFGLKVLHVAEREKNEPKKITLTLPSKSILRYAAVILILLGIFFISPEISDSSISDYAGVNNPLALFESATNAINKPDMIEEAVVQTIDSPKEYHIVVSCLSNMKSAERYCELLKAKHYDNARILPSIKTNRIVIESFSDKEIATLYLKKLRKNSKEFQDAWLYHEIIN